jgi:hypothetical protein
VNTVADLDRLLERLESLGVRASVRGGELELKGPADALDDDLVKELRTHKGELLQHLSATGAAPPGTPPAANSHTPGAKAPRRRPSPTVQPLARHDDSESHRPAPAASKHGAAELLKHLGKQGVRVSAKDGHLDLEGPVEKLEPELLDEVADRETELLQALRTEAPPKRQLSLLDRLLGWEELE